VLNLAMKSGKEGFTPSRKEKTTSLHWVKTKVLRGGSLSGTMRRNIAGNFANRVLTNHTKAIKKLELGDGGGGLTVRIG